MSTKVVHIITTLDVGGAERALFNLLSGGLNDAFDNHVISLTTEGHYGPLLRDQGVTVEALNLPTSPLAFLQLLTLNARLKKLRPDLIQCWMYHGNLMGLLGKSLAKSTRKIPTVWNIRHTLEDPGTFSRATRLVITLGKHLSRFTIATVYNSERAQIQHTESGYAAHENVVIPNGFDLELWAPSLATRRASRQQFDISDATPVIGFVGRGDRQKDIPTLLTAFAQARQSHPEATLVLVGRNHEKFFTDGQAPKGVRALGQRSDVQAIVPMFDLLVLSSMSEGFPNVIGEAMACGVPCVSTDVGDARTIVGNTGWVSQRADPNDLSEKLCMALASGETELARRGSAARSRMEAHFSIEAAVVKYTRLYQNIEPNT